MPYRWKLLDLKEGQMADEKRLHKSQKEKMIFGVAGGLAEYFGLDPMIMRLIFVLSILLGSLGFWVYIILAIILPKGPAPS